MHHLYLFGYDFFDLIIFIFLWVGGWNILEYVISQYIDISDRDAYFKANVFVIVIGIALLYIKHRVLKSPYI
jgi:hypothetical protein